MATNDGYSPYPTGLTAAEIVTALDRASNLADGTFVQFTEAATAPTTPKNGDKWRNTTLNLTYVAFVEGVTYVWLEE
jgi:hypothetical protein